MPAVSMRRRKFLVLGATMPFLSSWTAWASDPVDVRSMIRGGIERDSTGAVVSVFGLDPDVANEALLRATKADALPDGYAPTDLLSVGGQLIRSLIAADTRSLVAAASDDGVELYVGSGYRSQAYQTAVFAAQVKRWGDAETANRYSAQPGHSQHQLGTTIDFTNTFAAFRTSPAADWLRDNAHRFGFVLPYTPASVPLTGYVDEPWHARWVGTDLAGQLQKLGYQDWPTSSADDVVALVRSEAGLDA
jgi:LAS superfamily LD-carboxypeptidase LdcB